MTLGYTLEMTICVVSSKTIAIVRDCNIKYCLQIKTKQFYDHILQKLVKTQKSTSNLMSNFGLNEIWSCLIFIQLYKNLNANSNIFLSHCGCQRQWLLSVFLDLIFLVSRSANSMWGVIFMMQHKFTLREHLAMILSINEHSSMKSISPLLMRLIPPLFGPTEIIHKLVSRFDFYDIFF